MRSPSMQPEDLEPERYELLAEPSWTFTLPRRDFLRSLGGGVAVFLLLAPDPAAQERGSGGHGRRRGHGRGLEDEIGVWLHIAADSRVTVFTGKAEVGQDIRTSLAQVVAEELRVGAGEVTLVMADTMRVPYDRGTFGSRTTPVMAARLRRVAAAARELLADRAAASWEVPREELEVEAGRVTHGASGRTATLGGLTEGEKLVQAVVREPPMREPGAWTVAGRSVPKAGGRGMVTGTHRYASDIRRPGMLRGRVLRPPCYGSRPASADTSGAEALEGVTVVRDGAFIGVAAPDEAVAEEALRALQVDWTDPDRPEPEDLFEHLKANPVERRGWRGRSEHVQGDVEETLAQAACRLEAGYTVAYIAHVPLEPRAAVAEWEDGSLTVWTGTQRPFGVRRELARAFGLSEAKVRVIVPDTGSGYGGKHTGEAAVEAARLARAAKRPVKVAWSREEEFTWAYFRPAGVIDVRSGTTKDGKLQALEFHNYNSGSSGIRPPYGIDHQRIAFHPAESPLRQGSYRALAATANHFARESHVDEIASTLGVDPLAFRLRNLADDRVAAALKAAARRFGWAERPDAGGRGAGLACGTEKGGCVATCAEVAVDPSTRSLTVVRLVTAFECGAVINPDNLANQVEGAAVMGLGGALFESIEPGDGTIRNPRLARYRVPRFQDTPRIETVILDRKDLPSAGAGETPIVCVAPALANAIFAATGIRLRDLPMAPDGRVG